MLLCKSAVLSLTVNGLCNFATDANLDMEKNTAHSLHRYGCHKFESDSQLAENLF